MCAQASWEPRIVADAIGVYERRWLLQQGVASLYLARAKAELGRHDEARALEEQLVADG